MAEENGRVEEILKTIVTFDVEKDYEDEEAKEKLSNLFREFLMSKEEVVMEVLPKMLGSMTDILVELGIIEKEEEEEEASEKTSEEGDEEVMSPEDIETEEMEIESKKEKKLDKLVENANNFIYK